MKKVFLCSMRRKHNAYQRRYFVSSLRERQVKTVNFDTKEHEVIGGALPVRSEFSVKDHTHKSGAPIYKGMEDTLLAFMVRCILTLFFICIGILLLWEVIMDWNSYWTTLSHRISVIVLVLDCAACVALGVSVWRERDRGYLMSVFSALVSLAALAVSVVK